MPPGGARSEGGEGVVRAFSPPSGHCGGCLVPRHRGDRHRSEGHAWVWLRQHPASSLTSESIDPPWQKPWESPPSPASERDEGLRGGPPSSSRPAPGFHSPHQDTEAGRQRKRRGNQSRQDKS